MHALVDAEISQAMKGNSKKSPEDLCASLPRAPLLSAALKLTTSLSAATSVFRMLQADEWNGLT